MRNLVLIILGVVFLSGCASIDVPKYIKDKNPYKQTMYAGYDDVVNATSEVLEDLNWEITSRTDPSIFERSRTLDDSDNGKQTLFLTNIKDLGVVIGTRYARVNVYVTSITPKETEVEIRYLSVNSTIVKNFRNYKHDIAVKRMFDKIEEQLDE